MRRKKAYRFEGPFGKYRYGSGFFIYPEFVVHGGELSFAFLCGGPVGGGEGTHEGLAVSEFYFPVIRASDAQRVFRDQLVGMCGVGEYARHEMIPGGGRSVRFEAVLDVVYRLFAAVVGGSGGVVRREVFRRCRCRIRCDGFKSTPRVAGR